MQWWGEEVILFTRCLQQHACDRRLESPVGFFQGELWGYTGDVDTDVTREIPTHAEPHPGYLGRSPYYWVCHFIVHSANLLGC